MKNYSSKLDVPVRGHTMNDEYDERMVSRSYTISRFQKTRTEKSINDGKKYKLRK